MIFYVFSKVHFINQAIDFTSPFDTVFHKIDIKGVQVLIQADHVGEIWDLFFKTEKYILLDVSQIGNLSGFSMLFVGLKS